MESGQSSQSKGSRRVWKAHEEEALLTILEDVVNRGLRCDNGSFKSGTMIQIEKSLAEKFPNTDLRVVPHIESKMRFWKKLYGIIFDMINKSGFAWNDFLKCIEVDSDEAWNTYHNKDADGWRGKQCMICDRLKNIFGKDRATGRGSATPTEMMNEYVHHFDVNDDDEEVEVDPEHSASLPRSNQQNSASSSNRHRKRNADTDIQKEMAKAFGEMISESVDQVKTITNSLVKGSEPRPDIAAELAKMDLSINDQIKTLRLILEKASDERTFLTLDGAMRKAFVLLLLGAREL
ncbi:PREDICTED: uncharacterized protein LOC103333774 [Prunus mume]|uniref:Uncharacterized protein LOC103333774 n=1 Tax=Prunus mume TaxID=102107 RepID=A0ABM0P627_PRUMU|nr:PREDICTED: uncharacterized protein LOC103333774 [Prunus mume]